jgi:hypothetical protein
VGLVLVAALSILRVAGLGLEAEGMTIPDMITAAAAWTAILVSAAAIVVAGRQGHRLTRMTLADAYSGRQSENVIHFTDRYLDLIGDGMNVGDEHWRRELWGLLSTEFYFFSEGWLPTFIFQLWMIELARTYRDHPDVWQSHATYLDQFEMAYPQMHRFFHGLKAKASDNAATPSGLHFDLRAVTTYIASSAPRMNG